LILIFVVCFAVGLCPIPYLCSAEVCRPEIRNSIRILALLANYLGNIFLSLFFPALNLILGGYVFLIFLILILIYLIILFIKMPETKCQLIEKIEKFWNIPALEKDEVLLSKPIEK